MAKKEDSIKTQKKKSMSKEELQEALINNFISLQKALTNVTVKFDELSTNISKLLQLFEISAKSFAEKYSEIDETHHKASEIDKDFIKKLDNLLDQNKVISKGIMLIEERIREKSELKPQAFRPNDPRNNPNFNSRFQPRY